MNEIGNYYHLWCSAMESATADEQWYEEFRKTHPKCSACGRPKTVWTDIDICLSDYPRRTDFNFDFGSLIRFFSTDLLQLIPEDVVRECLYTGKVFDADGKQIEKYVTVKGKKERLTLRGNEESEYRICEVCSAHVYFAIGNMYLLPHSVESRLPMYQADRGFVVNEDIYQRLSVRKWKHAKLAKLAILDKPRDGLDHLLL